jgi:hypothetical protein
MSDKSCHVGQNRKCSDADIYTGDTLPAQVECSQPHAISAVPFAASQ